MKLVLASSSPSRKALLKRLNLPFICISPDVDESIQPGEKAHDLVMRLAQTKADTVITQLEATSKGKNHLVIAADQVASLGDTIFTKPLTEDKAKAQLNIMSKQLVTFLAGVCVINQNTNTRQQVLSQYQVHFRKLSAKTIAAYLAKEQPLQCAGSFKSEGLGIALVKYFKGDDPTSLIGLPLIHITRMLAIEGINTLPGL